MIWNEERNVQTQRNWFSRLAQVLSLSLPGFGVARSSENSSPPALSVERHEGPHKTFVMSPTCSENSKDFIAIDGGIESNGKDMSSMPLPVLQMSQMGYIMEQSRQRLAGHTTKIRLEPSPTSEPPSLVMISETPREILDVSYLSSLSTAPSKTGSASPTARQMISETPRETLDVSSPSTLPSRTEVDIYVSLAHTEATKQDAVPSHPPLRNGIDKAAVGNQRHLPIERMFKGNTRLATHSPRSGSGEFSCGQSDAVIKSSAVRASSVVMVMLTSNPGPVAVHYVSLLPHEGFTVHLTAPTTMHTRFNYLIFSTDSSGISS